MCVCVCVTVDAALMKIPPAQFKLLMDSIVWAFKHTMRNVAEIGLNVLLLLLQKFAQDQVGTQFFQTYFVDLMQHIFSVVTDSSHTASTYMYTVHKVTRDLWSKTMEQTEK